MLVILYTILIPSPLTRGLMAKEKVENLGFHPEAMTITPGDDAGLREAQDKGFIAGYGAKDHRRGKTWYENTFGGMWSRPRPSH